MLILRLLTTILFVLVSLPAFGGAESPSWFRREVGGMRFTLKSLSTGTFGVDEASLRENSMDALAKCAAKTEAKFRPFKPVPIFPNQSHDGYLAGWFTFKGLNPNVDVSVNPIYGKTDISPFQKIGKCWSLAMPEIIKKSGVRSTRERLIIEYHLQLIADGSQLMYGDDDVYWLTHSDKVVVEILGFPDQISRKNGTSLRIAVGNRGARQLTIRGFCTGYAWGIESAELVSADAMMGCLKGGMTELKVPPGGREELSKKLILKNGAPAKGQIRAVLPLLLGGLSYAVSPPVSFRVKPD